MELFLGTEHASTTLSTVGMLSSKMGGATLSTVGMLSSKMGGASDVEACPENFDCKQ
jgi:hypothetical protein